MSRGFAGRTLVLVATLSLGCGSRVPADAPDAVLSQARELFRADGPRAALPEFERALRLARAAGDRRSEAIALGQIGTCYKELANYDTALRYHEDALALKRAIGDREEEGRTLSNIGLVHWSQGRYADAIGVYQQAIAIFQSRRRPELEAAVLNNLSLVYDELGDYRGSMAGYERSLALHRASGFEAGEGDALGNIGGVHLLLGRFAQAKDAYSAALAISQRLGDVNATSLDLGNLGHAEAGLGNAAAALARYDEALETARRAGLARDAADWQVGRSAVLVRLARHEEALAALQAAIATYEASRLPRELADALSALADLHLRLGELGEADRALQRAAEVSRRLGYPRGEQAALLARADFESRRGRFDRAAAHFNEALSLAARAGAAEFVAASAARLARAQVALGTVSAAARSADRAAEAARQTGSPSLESEALLAQASASLAAGLPTQALAQAESARLLAERSADPELRWGAHLAGGRALEALDRKPEAIDAYLAAVAIIEDVRSRLQDQRWRSGYMQDKRAVIDAAVRLLIELGRAREAFGLAERSRASSYRDLLARGAFLRAAGPATPAPELIERMRTLQQRLLVEQRRTATERLAPVIETFSQELATATREYRSAVDALARRDPDAGRLQRLEVPDADDIGRRLPPDAAIVEYFVGRDHAAAFVVRQDGLRALTLPVTEADLRSRVDLLRDQLRQGAGTAWSRPAVALHEVLIGPLAARGWLEQTRRLWIVPHGPLHYLPFAVLHPGGDGQPRFLVDDHTLAYMPAAAMMAGPTPRARPAGQLLAAAPARTRLAHAREEAQRVAALLPNPRLVLIGTRATEGAWKREAPGYRVLHLATHGRFNRLEPLLSELELEPDATEDGRLQVFEVMALPLAADLVTLSACDTGLAAGAFADLPAGEDLVGLTRGFLSAGSKAVLASLWEIGDRTTVSLMGAFYEASDRSGPVTALAEAQRRMRRRAGADGHPRAWAPFVLVGPVE